MNGIDLVILLVVLWAAIRGWMTGFIQQIVSLLGFVLGLIVAVYFYNEGAVILIGFLSISPMFAKITSFIVLLVVVPTVLGMLAKLMTRTLKAAKVNMPNSVLGMFLGVIKYLILMSCIFNVMSELKVVEDYTTDKSCAYTRMRKIFYPAYHFVEDKGIEFFNDVKSSQDMLNTVSDKMEEVKRAVQQN